MNRCLQKELFMAEKIENPSLIDAAGSAGKVIREFVGLVNSGESRISIAHMSSPPGWSEPGQRPEFDEYTVVLTGSLMVETRDEMLIINANQGVLVRAGEWVKYSTPGESGADYIAVCIPAFSTDTVHRDDITL